MKKMKSIFSAFMFVGIMCVGMNTYANTTTTQATTVPTLTNEVKEVPAKELQKTEEYYVRITQPSLKDEAVQTFDMQMNIMGEASVGTEIKITVYYTKDADAAIDETTEKEEYILKIVGATKTFSQLIDLKEGLNKVIIQYQYENNGARGSLSLQINRRPEAEKELIKSHIKPEAIVNKIVMPTPDEKANALRMGVPTSK